MHIHKNNCTLSHKYSGAFIKIYSHYQTQPCLCGHISTIIMHCCWVYAHIHLYRVVGQIGSRGRS